MRRLRLTSAKSFRFAMDRAIAPIDALVDAIPPMELAIFAILVFGLMWS
jgi:hypothetical protein